MSVRRSSRRDFLKGRAAVDRLLDVTNGPADEGVELSQPAPVASATPYLVRVGRRAMACEFEVYFNAGQYRHDTPAAIEALDQVEALEEQLSIYREASELSQINRRAAAGPVAAEAGLFALVEQALHLFAETAGAYDITSGPLSRAWGFFRRAGCMPTESQIDDALQRTGGRHVRLDAERRTIAFLKPGIELNLNSIGKGYALDCAAQTLFDQAIENVLLHGGKSSMLARGSQAGEQQGGWVVGVRHPLWPDRRIVEVRLRDRAMATSGSAAQSFHYQGRRYGHILDPRTGWPADDVLSSTVLADSAALADALSTAFYVMGADAAVDFCRDHGRLGVILVCRGDAEGTVRLITHGLDPHDWRRVDPR